MNFARVHPDRDTPSPPPPGTNRARTAAARAAVLLLILAGGPRARGAGEAPPANTGALSRAFGVLTQRVTRARAELHALRRNSEDRRHTRNGQLRTLEADIDERRERLAARRNRLAVLETRADEGEKTVAALEHSLGACRTALYSLARTLSARLSELPGGPETPLFTVCRNLLDKPYSEPPDPRPLTQALDAYLRAGLHGERGRGEARDAAGIVHPGAWLRLGPGRWFAADTPPRLAGPLYADGPPPPAVASVSTPRARAVRAFIEGQGEASPVPVDVTGGAAADRAANGLGRWWRELREGGPIMPPLLLLGAAAFVVAVLRAVALLRLKVPAPTAGARLAALARRDPDKAFREAAVSWPAGPVLLQAVKHRNDSRERLEEALHEQILGEVPRLEKHLALLAVLAGVAPLLGLLGTVTGMIHTFDLVSLFGAGDVQILSGGISEALITTKTGLAIAIPTLLAHALLRRLSRNILRRLEELAIAFIEGADEPSAPASP